MLLVFFSTCTAKCIFWSQEVLNFRLCLRALILLFIQISEDLAPLPKCVACCAEVQVISSCATVGEAATKTRRHSIDLSVPSSQRIMLG